MMTESYAETVRVNTGSPYDYPVLTAELALSHFQSAAAHETGTVISNLPTDGETVTVSDVEGFYPRLLCSNTARTYSEILDSLARALGGVRLVAVFRDADGQPFVHSRVQTADGRPYYGRQKGVPSARDSYLLLPAGRPSRGEPLVVCEGEKAAAAAMSAGFAGACWSGGSGSVGTISVDEVDGVDVVLFPDNDHDGIRAMRAIGNRLDGVARSVRVADLAGMPDRADIADISTDDARRRIAASRGFAHFLRATGGPIREKGARQPVKLSSELRRLAHVMDFDSGTYLADFSADPNFNESGFAHLVLENQAGKLLAVIGDEGVEFLALRRNGTWSRDAEDLRRLISSVGKHYLRRMVNCSDQPPYDDDGTFFPAVRALRAVERGETIEGVPAAMRLAFQENRRLNKLPKNLLVCDESEIDADPRYRGFANGIVDTELGELLSAKSARRLLVSNLDESSYAPTTR